GPMLRVLRPQFFSCGKVYTKRSNERGRERLTPAKARIMGNAEGTIMPTIIAAHMAKRAERSAPLQGFMLTMHMAKGSRARYQQVSPGQRRDQEESRQHEGAFAERQAGRHHP